MHQQHLQFHILNPQHAGSILVFISQCSLCPATSRNDLPALLLVEPDDARSFVDVAWLSLTGFIPANVSTQSVHVHLSTPDAPAGGHSPLDPVVPPSDAPFVALHVAAHSEFPSAVFRRRRRSRNADCCCGRSSEVHFCHVRSHLRIESRK